MEFSISLMRHFPHSKSYVVQQNAENAFMELSPGVDMVHDNKTTCKPQKKKVRSTPFSPDLCELMFVVAIAFLCTFR